jgi:hypothetical protein
VNALARLVSSYAAQNAAKKAKIKKAVVAARQGQALSKAKWLST